MIKQSEELIAKISKEEKEKILRGIFRRSIRREIAA
jgi:hypothetical protein